MTNKPAGKALKPRLRFPEFREAGEWELSNFYGLLDEVIDFRRRTPKKLGMDWGDGDIISLSANNVKNGYIDLSAECNLGGGIKHLTGETFARLMVPFVPPTLNNKKSPTASPPSMP